MENVSEHTSVNEMYEILKSDGVSNLFDRFEAQDGRCPFCTGGISCQLCSNGPCRIKKGADRGACGIDADAMAMRNFLLKNIMGAATYTFHAKEVAKTLRATARGKTPFRVKDEEKLKDIAEEFGITGDNLLEGVAEVFSSLIKTDSDDILKSVEIFAPATRIKLWKELGILPGGPQEEMIDALSSCLTNVDGDYVSLAKKAMRLSIATIYGSQIPLELGQDILFGTPMPHEVDTDLGIIDPEYVNIVVNGHEPFVGAALIEAARSDEIQKIARDAGAKGLRIIGSIETGQELIQRFEVDDVFAGLTGNWISIEPMLATGCVDLLAMDMNCSPPAMGIYQDRYSTTLVSVSKLVAVPGMKDQIGYNPEEVRSQAGELIGIAIENFKRRRDKPGHSMARKQKAVAGISVEAILEVLGGSLDPLLDAIRDGVIRGVVALVSCTTLKNGPQDSLTVAVAKELIKRDILVVAAGCGNAALQVAGLETPEAKELAGEGLRTVCEKLGIPPVLSFGTCTDTGRIAMLVTAVADALGVDPSDLPVAVTAPEYMEQKATIDAVFAVAFGLYTHVSPTPPVTGADRLVKLLTEDVEELTGGKIAVGDDPVEIVDGIEAHINKKRAELGI